MRVYIAGAYSAKTPVRHDIPFEVEDNVVEAIHWFWRLVEKGHVPYVPHLSHYLCLRDPKEAMKYYNEAGDGKSFWYVFDFAWLAQCEAIFMMPNWKVSAGAVAEEKWAREHGLKVFYDINEVPTENQGWAMKP